ncbi:hypothetical protein B8W72_28410 [Pseudomonas putida]|uniref:Uncharacterized protein n=1 Tax=Pseudomonas putida TaxID=303 RepID=A0A1Y3KFM8_PSEPU|nr:hypothetical protein B8W72_28410 [Pseudomonas putida]
MGSFPAAGAASAGAQPGADSLVGLELVGAALQPIRGTRPLLQEIAYPCRSGLVPRMGRKAAPVRWTIRQSRSPRHHCAESPPSKPEA